MISWWLLFVYLRLDDAPDDQRDAAIAAVAGAIIGINAFNQPDVEASKVAARKLIERNDAQDRQLQTIRRAVRDTHRVTTCVGFDPRFLHSTGQAYKGGPNSGVFLQLTCCSGEP